MATPPDPLQDADYRSLIEALAREGLPRRTEAVRAVEAVLCALARRMSSGDFEDVRELLPEPFRHRLVACERHVGTTRNARAPRTDTAFYEMVAEDLEREPAEIEPAARAVFAAMRAQLGERDAEELAGKLPEELDALWRRPS